ncbi:putative transcriptional regulatory, LuxR family (plasmid) [Afipia carboxidovorans OM5]|uniref:Putative transcriptional regulatory, LuxR family n=1 Tax=Afipia carboxidovorans (strain ATCC 49405 / DSM 1227 / KCTC 32145 / OM5) TaxID=504832 RepID=F8C0Y1_AFIC5|nr:helix-turn-helix transcriptional regulator [Afipia carboxidovorans]AEI04463.1 putative transcriptional regulatory, LuxR family [Afipia carboxidovorans OM4]AEI08091.1 putative transcriptional regulatory, LuxR family [Afipia carboxidovorans OM5]
MSIAQSESRRLLELEHLYIQLREARFQAEHLQLTEAAALINITMLGVVGTLQLAERRAPANELIKSGQEASLEPPANLPSCGVRLVILSRRETQCLQMLAEGIAPKNIAATLRLSEAAVRLYLQRARKRLNCATTLQAAVKASTLGLIETH